MSSITAQDDALLQEALSQARDTKSLLIGRNAHRQVGDLFGALFGYVPSVIVADAHTFETLGREVFDVMRLSGNACKEPIVLDDDDLFAEYRWVDEVRTSLGKCEAIPISVGSGTINDLTKLAAHQCGRRYLSVATAASMDGYTAYGASITYKGSKQTFDCPAPLGVIADLDVIASAPAQLNASGYADLIAKCPAGADWILADALGVEAIIPSIWRMVQARLRPWMEKPEGVPAGDFETIRRLTLALMMSGFAMQAACTSRPASGAEHQFSHLWDMEHHQHDGAAPSHGFKVAIGSLASLALYEVLLESDIAGLDIDDAVDRWASETENEREVASLFSIVELLAKAREESRAKHISAGQLREELERLRSRWRTIHQRLSDQVVEPHALRDMLRAAGCPYVSPQIGISRDRLRESFRKAYHIRRRFTILDVVRRAGIWDVAIDRAFENPCLGENA